MVDASCAPVKGSDTGGRFGVKTRVAKPPVWAGEALMELPGTELPGSRCFGCPPVPNPRAGAAGECRALCVRTFHLIATREVCGGGDRERLICHPPAHGNLRGEVEMHPRSPGTKQSCFHCCSSPKASGFEANHPPSSGDFGSSHPLPLFLYCRLVSHRHCRKAAAFFQSTFIGLACFFSEQRGCFGGAFPTLSPSLCVHGGKGLVVRAPGRE